MEISKEKHNNLLSKVGLKSFMVWNSSPSMVYDESQFKSYVSPEYKNSQLREMDEVYRFFEIILLHTKTGLRIGYTTSESYDGEVVEYKVNSIFIITETNERHEVSDVDFNEHVFFAFNKIVPFDKVNKLVL